MERITIHTHIFMLTHSPPLPNIVAYSEEEDHDKNK